VKRMHSNVNSHQIADKESPVLFHVVCGMIDEFEEFAIEKVEVISI